MQWRAQRLFISLCGATDDADIVTPSKLYVFLQQVDKGHQCAVKLPNAQNKQSLGGRYECQRVDHAVLTCSVDVNSFKTTNRHVCAA